MAQENPGSPEIPGSLENNSRAENNSASQENIFGPQSQQDQDGSSAPAPAPASEADAHESMATDLDPNKSDGQPKDSENTAPSDGQPEDTESDQPNGLDADGTISETASDALSSRGARLINAKKQSGLLPQFHIASFAAECEQRYRYLPGPSLQACIMYVHLHGILQVEKNTP